MKVQIVYFKETGKFYTTEPAEWEPDPLHYSGWKLFSDVVRLKDMFAVCIMTPLGFPQFYKPNALRRGP